MWELALRASPALGLREAAMPLLEDAHAVLGQHVQLGVRDGAEVLFVERLSAPGAVINITRIARRLPLPVSSAGHVLLAFGPRSAGAIVPVDTPRPTVTGVLATAARGITRALANQGR